MPQKGSGLPRSRETRMTGQDSAPAGSLAIGGGAQNDVEAQAVPLLHHFDRDFACCELVVSLRLGSLHELRFGEGAKTGEEEYRPPAGESSS